MCVVTDLQRKISVLLFLPHLEAGEVGVFELQAVLLFKILSHSALHGLAIFELKGEPAIDNKHY